MDVEERLSTLERLYAETRSYAEESRTLAKESLENSELALEKVAAVAADGISTKRRVDSLEKKMDYMVDKLSEISSTSRASDNKLEGIRISVKALTAVVSAATAITGLLGYLL